MGGDARADSASPPAKALMKGRRHCWRCGGATCWAPTCANALLMGSFRAPGCPGRDGSVALALRALATSLALSRESNALLTGPPAQGPSYMLLQLSAQYT